MSPRRTAALVALPVAVLIGLSGCGSDDDTGADAAPDDAAPTDAGGGCAGTDLVLTDLASGAETALDDAAAVSIEDGRAYTVYVADFDIPADQLSAVAVPTVPADGAMTTIAVTVFNATEPLEPIEPGTTIPYTDDFGVLTFRITHAAGSTMLANNTGGTGDISVAEVGTTLCLEVDYADEEKTVTGTVEAAVKDL